MRLLILKFLVFVAGLVLGGCILPSPTPTPTAPYPVANLKTNSLYWVPSYANTDGSALSDLGGFKVYWGTSSQFDHSFFISDPKQTSVLFSTLGIGSSGRYFTAVSEYDRFGVESSMSSVFIFLGQ